MSNFIKKLIGLHTCFNCEQYINKKDVYSVDLDTMDGPLNLKLCQNCADDFDDMLKDLQEKLDGQRNNTL